MEYFDIDRIQLSKNSFSRVRLRVHKINNAKY